MNNLKAAIYEAIGEGSMCWEKPEGAGVFDSTAADRVASRLLDEVRDLTAWTYRAVVKRIVDGDTVDVVIDLGFGVQTFQRLRLARIDAPEKRGEERVEGLASEKYLNTIIPVGSEIRIRSSKDDSFGRYIAEIWVSGWQNVNDLLVEGGHAVYKDYD